jgi:hypothetical protein
VREFVRDGQHLGVDLAELGDQCLVGGHPGPLAAGQAGVGFPLVRLVLEQVQVVGLVAVHADDPGHRVIVEKIRAGPGGLQQLQLVPGHRDALADVAGKPAQGAEGVPVLLTFGPFGHPPSVTIQGRRRG